MYTRMEGMIRMNMRPTASTLLVSALAGAVGGGLGLGLGALVFAYTFWFILFAAIPVGAAVAGFVATWLTIVLRWALHDRTPAWPKRSFILWAIGSIPIVYATILLSPFVCDNLVIDSALVVSGCALIGLIEAHLRWPRTVQQQRAARAFLQRYH